MATTTEQAVKDVAATVAKAFDDTVRTAAKAGEDTVAEADRFGRELGVAGRALAKGAAQVPGGLVDAAEQAAMRARSGKFVDALWHASLAPIQVAERSTSEAVLESDYLRTIGQVAVTATGAGPAATAAYAAWLAYRESGGNAGLALRVGVLTGASAAAFGAANKIDDVTRRAIVVGAIGGLAVAGAGGGQDAVTQAFLNAGAMVVVQDGFRNMVKSGMDGRPSQGEEYCISAQAVEAGGCTPLPPGALTGVDEKGNFTVDMTKVDPRIPAVGLKDHTALFNEGNVVMKAISKIPGMQAMALFHDQWALSWDMGALMTPATIQPAIVLTYMGFGTPFYEQLRETAVEDALNKGKPGGTVFSPRPAADATVVSPVSVRDSYALFKDGTVKQAYLLEAKPRGLPRWCSAANEALIKRSLKPGPGVPKNSPLVGTDISSCLRKTATGFRTVYPRPVDMACRALAFDGKDWRVLTSSLFDHEACSSTIAAHVERRDKSEPWFRADSRRKD